MRPQLGGRAAAVRRSALLLVVVAAAATIATVTMRPSGARRPGVAIAASTAAEGSQAAVKRPGRGRATEARWSALLLMLLSLLLRAALLL